MNPKLMIWSSVALSALAQICLKHGLTKAQERVSAGAGIPGLILSVASQTFIWLWALCFALATTLWLLGLQRLDLSYAYPLVSFGYVLVSMLSALLFHERVDANRWAAIAVLSIGVFLIAGS
jgi:undecaprenyl phosphate-alpha-L-ara4N flippase subunit ArnE